MKKIITSSMVFVAPVAAFLMFQVPGRAEEKAAATSSAHQGVDVRAPDENKAPAAADKLLAKLRALPAEERAKMKAEIEQAKQQLSAAKAMAVVQAGNDPAAMEDCAMGEALLNAYSKALELIDQSDAAKAAGDAANQAKADKTLLECAEKAAQLEQKVEKKLEQKRLEFRARAQATADKLAAAMARDLEGEAGEPENKGSAEKAKQ